MFKNLMRLAFKMILFLTAIMKLIHSFKILLKIINKKTIFRNQIAKTIKNKIKKLKTQLKQLK